MSCLSNIFSPVRRILRGECSTICRALFKDRSGTAAGERLVCVDSLHGVYGCYRVRFWMVCTFLYISISPCVRGRDCVFNVRLWVFVSWYYHHDIYWMLFSAGVVRECFVSVRMCRIICVRMLHNICLFLPVANVAAACKYARIHARSFLHYL